MGPNERSEAAIKAYSEQLRRLQVQVTPAALKAVQLQQHQIAELNRALPQIQRVLAQVTASVDWDGIRQALNQVAAYQAKVLESVKPALEQFREAARRLPPRVRDAFVLLARRGWFMDPNVDLAALWEYERLALAASPDELETAVCKHFERRLDLIESYICSRFPSRSHLFASAFAAHRAGSFELSIPLLLAQTDGMCRDALDASLFSKRRSDGRPATVDFVDQLEVDSLRAALLAPLAESLPIAASARERSESFDELNRHQVMHGESLDYGTRINGLKAVSLANYIATMIDVDALSL